MNNLENENLEGLSLNTIALYKNIRLNNDCPLSFTVANLSKSC